MAYLIQKQCVKKLSWLLLFGSLSFSSWVYAENAQFTYQKPDEKNQTIQNISPKNKTNPTRFSVGVIGFYSSKGLKNYDANKMIVPSITYDDGRFFVRGLQAGVRLNKNRWNQFSVFAQYGGGSYDTDKATGAYKDLDDKKATVMFGANYQLLTRRGGLRVGVARDVFGESKGNIGRVSYLGRYKEGNILLFPSIGAKWQDKNFNDYYYGVTSKESAKTGIDSYTPKDSIQPFINVIGTYKLDENWFLFLNQNIAYNTDELYNSPKVADRVAYMTLLGFNHQF